MMKSCERLLIVVRTDDKKLKLVYLMDIFRQYTDETHGLTINEIAEKMSAFGYTPERKSLYSDFDSLGSYGFCIEKDSKRPPHYYHVKNPEKDISLTELKLICDCVRSSKFMDEQVSSLLIEKLKNNVSGIEALALSRQITVLNRAKKTNSDLQNNLDCIFKAIDSNLQIKFKYAYYDEHKKRRYRKKADTNGFYFASPYKLIYTDDNYFLLAYESSNHPPKIKHFRVDKMAEVGIVVAEREGLEAYQSILDIDHYTNYTFSMYGGEVRNVTLVFINHITDTIIDRFGSDITITRFDDTHSKVIVPIALSNAFYAWVFGLGKRIQIAAPQEAIDGMKKLLDDVSEKYNT